MKKILLLTALFLGAGLLMQAQTFSYNASSGTISVGCSTTNGTNGVIYNDNVTATWNVNIGQNTKVKIIYGCNLESGYDYVDIYSVDANGNSYGQLSLTGTVSGTTYSTYPTGKIKVVFRTDGSICCGQAPNYYSGFFISFAPDDQTSFGLGPTLFQGPISGNLAGQALRIQTISGNLDLGPQSESYANISTDRPGFFFNKPVYLQNGMLGTYYTTGADLQFITNGTNRMTIRHSNGNVGIGTTAPNYKLEVNGTIRAKELILETTGWPDFIFSPDYRLPSLENVANHIKQYNRLPEVPSEAEIKENGVNMGEMQVKLLQKIEELTLYMIRQQEMIDKLNAKIEKLEKSKEP